MEKFKIEEIQYIHDDEFIKWINNHYNEGWEYVETFIEKRVINSSNMFLYYYRRCFFKRI